VALCRPEVICAYPITPQTHIVEALGAKVKAGKLRLREFLSVESEFAAMPVAIGASAAGARAYTATGSQGLLHMSEAVYNAAGLGLPIVMTVANQAIGAPIGIWNDHSDAMSQRDAGWIQLYAETSQEALDLHIQAFRLAEELSVPVMVCMDGFLLTHAYERAEIPVQDQVDAFLPTYGPRQVPGPAAPVPIGAMAGPESFTEVRYLAHARQSQALGRIPEIAAEFGKTFGRDSGGLVRGYRIEDAETVVVALGSVIGTVKDTIDELRDDGMRAGVLGITTYRPFPVRAVRDALGTGRSAQRIVVLERALATGMGGIVSADLRMALTEGIAPGQPAEPIILTVIAGLGGRPITRASLRNMLTGAVAGTLQPMSFLDLKKDLVEREFLRARRSRRSGPSAENMPRGHGAAAARIG
jgi:pyruvate ferredoxin oxidoreductase alpha subunit